MMMMLMLVCSFCFTSFHLIELNVVRECVCVVCRFAVVAACIGPELHCLRILQMCIAMEWEERSISIQVHYIHFHFVFAFFCSLLRQTAILGSAERSYPNLFKLKHMHIHFYDPPFIRDQVGFIVIRFVCFFCIVRDCDVCARCARARITLRVHTVWTSVF